LIDKNIASGMSRDEARRQAILEFGGKEQVAEQLREVHEIPVIEILGRNLKFALRLMVKSPLFSAAIILTLALGIGANSAVFSALDAVLLRPLPFPDPAELVMVRHNSAEQHPSTFGSPVAPVRLEDWNRMSSEFQAITGYYTESESETSGPV